MNDDFKGLEPIAGTPLGTSHGIAAIALNLALKYHDIATVKDGTMYQQYKMEGRNMRELHLDIVFETAIKMEMYLLGSSERIAKMVIDAVVTGVEESEGDAAAVKDGWQDIASAPENEDVIIWHPDYAEPELACLGDGQWRQANTGFWVEQSPKFWRPLPPPPSQEKRR